MTQNSTIPNACPPTPAMNTPMKPVRIKLTKNDAEEIMHKIGVLCDTPDLQESYGMTQLAANHLFDSIPRNGGEWVVEAWAIEAVKGEMQDHAKVMRHCAHDARRHLEVGQALGIEKQATRFEKTFA